MSEESTIGRITPYEVVFGVTGFGEREFPVSREEADAVDEQGLRRDQFAGLKSVGGALAQLVPDEADPGALDHFLGILFHCFNFWKAGHPVYAFEAPVLHKLVDGPPLLADLEAVFPNPSFYVEMPHNLFWSPVSEGETPEPLEGFFVDVSRIAPSLEVDVLMILGMRADRPGFGVVGTTIDLAEIRSLDEPDAFASDIPGADLAGLYSIQRSSEIGILLLRLLRYIGAHPKSLERVEGSTSPPTERGYTRPTALALHRVSLSEEGNRG
jgi:hypothetical protein